MRDPNVVVRCFVVAGRAALLPIQNIQVLGPGSAAFPLASKRQALGMSYDKKEIEARISA